MAPSSLRGAGPVSSMAGLSVDIMSVLSPRRVYLVRGQPAGWTRISAILARRVDTSFREEPCSNCGRIANAVTGIFLRTRPRPASARSSARSVERALKGSWTAAVRIAGASWSDAPSVPWPRSPSIPRRRRVSSSKNPASRRDDHHQARRMNPRHPEADFPRDPIAAVTHRDPYPYYASLVSEKPFYRDEALGLWVASSAEAVTAVLTSDLCRVRPPAEPVPKALLGSPAADIFRHLVRMNDGMGHCPFRQAVSATLDSVDRIRAAEQSKASARALANELEPMADPCRLADFAFRLPVYVVASLLGIPEDGRGQVARWTGDFVRCLSPLSTPEQIEQSKAAAGQLLDLFRSLLAGRRTGSLLGTLAGKAQRLGREDVDVIVANG